MPPGPYSRPAEGDIFCSCKTQWASWMFCKLFTGDESFWAAGFYSRWTASNWHWRLKKKKSPETACTEKERKQRKQRKAQVCPSHHENLREQKANKVSRPGNSILFSRLIERWEASHKTPNDSIKTLTVLIHENKAAVGFFFLL